MTRRQNGSVSGCLLDLLVTPMPRKYRLSGGCPISPRAGIRFDSLSRLFRLLPHSTMHILSRCHISSPKDSRSHLVWDRKTSWVLVSNVAMKATMPRSVPKTS